MSPSDLLNSSQPFTIISIEKTTADGALIVAQGVRFAIDGMPAGFIDKMFFSPTALDQVLKKIVVVQPKPEHPEVGKIWINEQAEDLYLKKYLEESADTEVRSWMMHEMPPRWMGPVPDGPLKQPSSQELIEGLWSRNTKTTRLLIIRNGWGKRSSPCIRRPQLKNQKSLSGCSR